MDINTGGIGLTINFLRTFGLNDVERSIAQVVESDDDDNTMLEQIKHLVESACQTASVTIEALN